MRKLGIILLICLLIIPASHAAKGDFIILRCDVNPLYIENESVFIRAFVLVFRDGRPTDEGATLQVEIQGLNTEYSYSKKIDIKGGRRTTVSLPALKEGHYRIKITAVSGGMKSQTASFEFGVSKPPVPYRVYFNQDGSKVHFVSMKLNETGQPDPKYPFTIKIWYSQYGEDAVLIKTIHNVTEITIDIPSSIRRSLGIVYVDVIDCYGWKNSASMDMQNFYFTGMPISYAYGYRYMEPFKSRLWHQALIALFIILIIIVLIFFIARKAGGEKYGTE